MPEAPALTYARSGVDIAAGEEAVSRIRSLGAATRIPGVLSSLGGFAGAFSLAEGGWGDPVLVSSTDGVGTKSAVATAAGRFDTIGIDLVAMCVDDVVCVGARPVFLLDYLSVGHLDPAMAQAIVTGVATGCTLAGAALLGGEMAEHPGTMEPGCFDLAGFAVGVVERGQMLGPDRVRAGDVLIGLASPGLRCNGYSLARAALLDRAGRSLDEQAWSGAGRSLSEVLLTPSVVYAPSILALGGPEFGLRVCAHITGGGIPGNLNRALPKDCDAVVDIGAWEVPRIFSEVRRAGAVEVEEMVRTFNMGVGMIAVVSAAGAEGALANLGGQARIVGTVESGSGSVRLRGDWKWGE